MFLSQLEFNLEPQVSSVTTAAVAKSDKGESFLFQSKCLPTAICGVGIRIRHILDVQCENADPNLGKEKCQTNLRNVEEKCRTRKLT